MKNVPNILSSIRICLVPIFVLTYYYESGSVKIYAAAIYAAASITDFLDGYIARKYSLISNLGKVLDPLGDKLMTLAVLACITLIDHVIPIWVVIAALIKELLMLLGGVIIRKREGGEVPSSNIIGKTSTVVFFVVCVTLMLFRKIPAQAATLMISAAVILMLMALISYIMTFINVIKKTNGYKRKI